MTTSFSDLRKVIAESLRLDWDPIGVGQIPEAFDEYDAYVEKVCDLVCSDRNLEQMFDFLWWLETEYIGMPGDRENTFLFAGRLLEIRKRFCS